jgi:hypothetical protein
MNQGIPFLQKGGDKLLFLHFKIQLYIKLNGIPVEPPERGQPDKGELSCVY